MEGPKDRKTEILYAQIHSGRSAHSIRSSYQTFFLRAKWVWVSNGIDIKAKQSESFINAVFFDMVSKSSKHV
jgi:hypothetical protein